MLRLLRPVPHPPRAHHTTTTTPAASRPRQPTAGQAATALPVPVPAPGGGPGRRNWLMLAVLVTGLFMALLDVTIVNVAMPTIGRNLHARACPWG